MQTRPRLAAPIPCKERLIHRGARSFKPHPADLSPQMHTNSHTHTYSCCKVFRFGGRVEEGMCVEGAGGGVFGAKKKKKKGGLGAESCVRLSEGGLRRVKGEFGATEDGLLARGRRQRRLIHPGRSYGGCHRRSCGDHWPEGIQRGDRLGGHRGHSGDCGHTWHARNGCDCVRRWVGVLELGVLLQLLVVLRIVPERSEEGEHRGIGYGGVKRTAWGFTVKSFNQP